jgi:hypothetical protein
MPNGISVILKDNVGSPMRDLAEERGIIYRGGMKAIAALGNT